MASSIVWKSIWISTFKTTNKYFQNDYHRDLIQNDVHDFESLMKQSLSKRLNKKISKNQNSNFNEKSHDAKATEQIVSKTIPQNETYFNKGFQEKESFNPSHSFYYSDEYKTNKYENKFNKEDNRNSIFKDINNDLNKSPVTKDPKINSTSFGRDNYQISSDKFPYRDKHRKRYNSRPFSSSEVNLTKENVNNAFIIGNQRETISDFIDGSIEAQIYPINKKSQKIPSVQYNNRSKEGKPNSYIKNDSKMKIYQKPVSRYSYEYFTGFVEEKKNNNNFNYPHIKSVSSCDQEANVKLENGGGKWQNNNFNYGHFKPALSCDKEANVKLENEGGKWQNYTYFKSVPSYDKETNVKLENEGGKWQNNNFNYGHFKSVSSCDKETNVKLENGGGKWQNNNFNYAQFKFVSSCDKETNVKPDDLKFIYRDISKMLINSRASPGINETKTFNENQYYSGEIPNCGSWNNLDKESEYRFSTYEVLNPQSLNRNYSRQTNEQINNNLRLSMTKETYKDENHYYNSLSPYQKIHPEHKMNYSFSNLSDLTDGYSKTNFESDIYSNSDVRSYYLKSPENSASKYDHSDSKAKRLKCLSNFEFRGNSLPRFDFRVYSRGKLIYDPYRPIHR